MYKLSVYELAQLISPLNHSGGVLIVLNWILNERFPVDKSAGSSIVFMRHWLINEVDFLLYIKDFQTVSKTPAEQ